MRSVFTIATGAIAYREMALNCARSFRRWNAHPFYIYTDGEMDIPAEIVDVYVRKITTAQYGTGFGTKLHLDEFAPTEQALFIDADCLVFGDLTDLFDALSGRAVAVLGYKKLEGEMFGDVAEICKRANVDWLPHFNGGVYYIERSSVSAAVFALARELEPRYDDMGIVRLRGQPNDEMLVGIAMSRFGLDPAYNDGSFYADLQWWPQVLRLDVVSGVAHMRNPEFGHPQHQESYPADRANPTIVHFLGHHVDSVLYKREIISLKLQKLGLLGRLIALLSVSPITAINGTKQILRPFYRCLIGVRGIGRSKSRYIAR